ncbi:MAG TPA: lipopolysaccharide biosynthesis protein [Candidatus Lokiarchaeia archaeon]|nr:lipopolysaccharide biosynthesis protein [Candidatus Lokiarchaeia archaeon]
MKRRTISCMLLCCVMLATLGCVPKHAGAIPPRINVLYIGSDYPDWHDAPVLAALRLDPTFHVTVAESNDSLDTALIDNNDVVFMQDSILNASMLLTLKNWTASGHCIVIFAGPLTTRNVSTYTTLGIVPVANASQIEAGYTNAVPALVGNQSSSITSGFDWKAVPDIDNYTILPYSSAIKNGLLVYKESRQDSSRPVNDPLIFTLDAGTGKIVVVTAWVDQGFSLAFRECPFFNYIVYSLAITRGGLDSDKYAYGNWPYSPVPHVPESIYFLLVVMGACVFCVVMIVVARRKSRTAIDVSGLQAPVQSSSEETEPRQDEVGIEGNLPETGSGESFEEGGESAAARQEVPEDEFAKISGWDRIGLHKQISGFFISLMAAIIAAGPQVFMILYVYPRYIMPFPQAAGIFGIVNDMFSAVLSVLDLGTSIALVTFFAANRIEHPEKATHYIQLYIYWQLVTGMIQFSTVSILGLYVFPNIDSLAYLSWAVIIHSMIRFPGFTGVMLLTLRALQRSDLEQISNLTVNFVLNFAVNYLCVLLFRWVYLNYTQYGEVFGAVMGLNMGAWLANWTNFFFSYYLFHRAGYKGGALFRLDFTRGELVEVLKYGVRLTIGGTLVPLVALYQTFLLISFVPDYNSEYAYYTLANSLGAVIGLVGMFTDSLQSPIAEAYEFKTAHGKEKYLERVYTTTFKYVNFLNFFLMSVLLVVGWRIIIGFAGPTWARAAFYLNIVLIFQLLGPYAWIGDRFFTACKMPNMAMLIWIMEQSLRAFFMTIFIPFFGLIGMVYGYIPATFCKDLACIIMIRKRITRPKMYFFQNWIGPAIAAVVTYLTLNLVVSMIWNISTQILAIVSSILIFFLAVFGFVMLFCFITGWLGAWDENEMKELKLAVDIAVKGLNLYIKIIYYSIRAGMRTPSPFVGRSKIDIWEGAQVEMDELQRMKKKLVL